MEIVKVDGNVDAANLTKPDHPSRLRRVNVKLVVPAKFPGGRYRMEGEAVSEKAGPTSPAAVDETMTVDVLVA